MSEPRTCPQCGSPLPADAPDGMCPKCLLQMGFESQAGPEADDPAYSPTVYQPSSLPPPVEELAAKFPQLDILERIGQGGMGVVYKARQKDLDRVIALKILRPGIESDPAFAKRFAREARALAKLSHPAIVTVHDFGRIDGFYYFIMEYVEGANLRELERSGMLEPQQALAIVPQICEALQYAHDQGVVHRDIKPENILIDKQGRVKIADFGLAKMVGAVPDATALTGAWQVMGTPHYMAPEQMKGSHSVDHRADIYSLGVVIYEMLTGELPVGRFSLPSEKVQVDVRLDEVVLRALEREPERRYQKASEVKTEIENISSAGPMEASAARGGSTAMEWRVTAMRDTGTGEERNKEGARQVLRGTARLLMCVNFLVLVIGSALLIPHDSGSFAVSADPLPLERPIKELVWFHLAFYFRAVVYFLFPAMALSVCCYHLAHNYLEAQHGRLIDAGDPAAVQRLLRRPAAGLVASGIATWVGLPLVVLATLPPMFAPGTIVATVGLLFLAGGVVIVAGVTMGRLKGYPLAVLGSLLALVAVPGNLIGIPMGVWALCLLMHREVKAAFGRVSSDQENCHDPDRSQVKPLTAPGRPLANIRFSVNESAAVLSQAKFHFGNLGYELISQDEESCIFGRGNWWAGMCTFDIREVLTRLTVRLSPPSDGRRWVSCLWMVDTTFQWITRRDKKVLSEEGCQFEALFRGGEDRDGTQSPGGGTSSHAAQRPSAHQGGGTTASDLLFARRMLVFTLLAYAGWMVLLAVGFVAYIMEFEWYFKQELPWRYLNAAAFAFASWVLFGLVCWWYAHAKRPDVPRSLADFWISFQREDERTRRLLLWFAVFLGVWVPGMVLAMIAGSDETQLVVMHLPFVAGPPAFLMAVRRVYGPLTVFPAEAAAGRESRTFGSWWSSLPTLERRMAKAVLALLALLLVLVFISWQWRLEQVVGPEGVERNVQFTQIGAGSPWYRSEREGEPEGLLLSRRINLLSWSMLAGVLGAAVLWLLIVLARIEQRAARGGDDSTSDGSGETGGGWSSLPDWLRKSAHVLLALVYAAGLLLFFGFGASRRPDENVFQIGQPAPWMRVEQAASGFQWSLQFGSSLVAGLVGLAALLLERKLTRLEGGREDAIEIHYSIWGALLAFVSALGVTSFVLHAQRLPLDRPATAEAAFPPVLSEVLFLGALVLLGLVTMIASLVTLYRRKMDGAPPATRVRAPAIGLIALAVVGGLLDVWLLTGPMSSLRPHELTDMIGWLTILYGISLAGRVLTLAGGICMLLLKHRPLAIAGTVMVMLPISMIAVLGIPIGIWALLVLLRPGGRRSPKGSKPIAMSTTKAATSGR